MVVKQCFSVFWWWS